MKGCFPIYAVITVLPETKNHRTTKMKIKTTDQY